MKKLRVASHLAPGVEGLYAFLADHLAERLGREAEFTVAESYARCAEDVDDVCFVCSVPYLLFADAGRIDMEVVAAPVLKGERYADRPVYYSDVVVRTGSPFHAFADLRGSTWAYNEPFSHSGYLVVLHHLYSMGEDTTFFGEMVEAGFHATALRMVADGSVDAAAIDSQVLAIELRDDAQLARHVRVIGAIGPSTIQPVVASATRLTSEERTVIRHALCEIDRDPVGRTVLDAAFVERFSPVGEDAYADIRLMLSRVRDAGLAGDAWTARWQEAIAAPTRA